MLGALIRKELLALRRDMHGLAALFLMPMVFIVLMSLVAVGQLWLESVRGFTSFAYPLQIWRLSGVGVLAFAFGLALAAYVAHRFAPHRWGLYVAAAIVAGLALWPILPGFDGMALGFVMGPSVVSLLVAILGARARLDGVEFHDVSCG